MIKPSVYKEAMDAAREFMPKMIGNILLVEKPDAEELKSEGGIFLASAGRQVNSTEANLPAFVHVLAVGPGYYDDTTLADVPLDTKPGDVILVGSLAVKWFSRLGAMKEKQFSIGVCLESDVQLRFGGYEQYKKWTEAFNAGIK
jgi:co-chaperonin GroES (HSP10)